MGPPSRCKVNELHRTRGIYSLATSICMYKSGRREISLRSQLHVRKILHHFAQSISKVRSRDEIWSDETRYEIRQEPKSSPTITLVIFYVMEGIYVAYLIANDVESMDFFDIFFWMKHFLMIENKEKHRWVYINACNIFIALTLLINIRETNELKFIFVKNYFD